MMDIVLLRTSLQGKLPVWLCIQWHQFSVCQMINQWFVIQIWNKFINHNSEEEIKCTYPVGFFGETEALHKRSGRVTKYGVRTAWTPSSLAQKKREGKSIVWLAMKLFYSCRAFKKTHLPFIVVFKRLDCCLGENATKSCNHGGKETIWKPNS